MRSFIVLLLALFASTAHAGSANCTNSQTLSSPQLLTLTPSDCIIVADIPTENMGAIDAHLPESANEGDEFTIQDTSPYLTESGSYFNEETQEEVFYSYDYTGGVGLTAPSSDAVWSFSPSRYVKAVYTSGVWTFSDGNL